jgi:hypothetical protein
MGRLPCPRDRRSAPGGVVIYLCILTAAFALQLLLDWLQRLINRKLWRLK